jgi:hypothetical protein
VLVRVFYETTGLYTEPRLIQDEADFTMVAPCDVEGQHLYMREYLAIYLTLFYLGSLVRYAPHHLDDLLGGKAAWMFESFVKSAPLMTLRAFVAKITGTVYALNK